MSRFTINDTALDGLKVITPFYMEDERGSFTKYYEKNIYKELGIDYEVAEAFETVSKKNVIRGLHFQTEQPQAKLVRVIYGEIMDVAVDIRKDSKTFSKYEVVNLSDTNKKIFYIPEGFAHGFCVLSDMAIVSYMCRGQYLGEYDTGIVWNDPEIAVKWPIENPIVSDKDNKLMSLDNFKKIYIGL